MNRTVLTEREDLRWLQEVHLPGVPIEKYAVAVLTGNEDSPERIELYRHGQCAQRPESYAIDVDGTYIRE